MQLVGKLQFMFGYNLELEDRSTRCSYVDYSARLQQGHREIINDFCWTKINVEVYMGPREW